jgi:hypothetical protein
MAVAANRTALSRPTGRVPVQPLLRRPSVSVVIPCYRYGHHLPGAVASALGQPAVDVDVIVVDDASPDDSAAVGAALARSDPRIRFVAHARNQGHIATFNEGLDLASGDYVVLLSADDLLTPGSLERATALLDAHPNVGFAYGHPRDFVDELPEAGTEVRDWSIWSGQDWLARRCHRGSNCIFCPEVVMRRSVKEAVGGYNPALPHSGDLEMWLRLATVADVGRVNGADQGYYRVHDESMQRTVYAGLLRDLEERRAAFASVLLDGDRPVADGTALYARACRALSVAALDRVCWAYDVGATDDEPVAEYVAFALEVDPAIVGSPRWRTVQHRRSRGPERCQQGLAVRGRLVTRDLGDRIRWRRWRRSGV